MREAAVAIVYPDEETFDAHVTSVLELLPGTRAFPGCIEAHVGVSAEGQEIAVFHIWESQQHLDDYLNWRADRGDLDARSKTMRREQSFSTFSIP